MGQTSDVVDIFSSSHSRLESDEGMLLSIATIPMTPPILSSMEAHMECYSSTLNQGAIRRSDSLFPPNNHHAVQIVHMLNQQ